MVGINYSQVRIKVDTLREIGCGYCWRVNKLSQQTKYKAELFRVDCGNRRVF